MMPLLLEPDGKDRMTKFRVESRDRDRHLSANVPYYLSLLRTRSQKKKAICGDVVKFFVCSDLLMECLAFTRLCLRGAFKEGKKKRWKKMVTKTGRGGEPCGSKLKERAENV